MGNGSLDTSLVQLRLSYAHSEGMDGNRKGWSVRTRGLSVDRMKDINSGSKEKTDRSNFESDGVWGLDDCQKTPLSSD
jgi:hypothetical protein